MGPTNSGYSFRHVLGPSAVGHTTTTYLVANFVHSTQDQWLQRIRAREIQIDGAIASGDERLKPGGVLIWNRPAWTEEEVPTNFGILYRDEFLFAAHKPSGLPTLPGAGFFHNTLLTQVQRVHPTAIPLHRLGRATSGIVLFAFDRKTAASMSKQWGAVHKEYRTLVRGETDFDVLSIRTPIGLIPHPRLGKIYGATWSGKESRSSLSVLQRRSSATICSVELLTGRPHQIRIHLASIGHPLIGDPVYGLGGGIIENPGLPGDSGYFLHAHRIGFHHPVSGDYLSIEAPLPSILSTDSF